MTVLTPFLFIIEHPCPPLGVIMGFIMALVPSRLYLSTLETATEKLSSVEPPGVVTFNVEIINGEMRYRQGLRSPIFYE